GDVYEQYSDEEGFIQQAVADAEQVLIDALAAQPSLPEAQRLNPEEHERLITTLFDLWYTDVFEIGGIGLSQGGPDAIATHGTAEERATVLAQLQGLRSTSNWANDMTGNFK